MKAYLSALFSLDPVKTVRAKKEAIDKEHRECIETASRELDRDALAVNQQQLAMKWVAKQTPATFSELLQASTRRVVSQEILSAIVSASTARHDQQTADLAPLCEAALQAVDAKLAEQRQAVVEADAKRFEETEIDEPSTKTLALIDGKLEAVKKGRAIVNRNTQSALGYLFQAVDGRPPKPSPNAAYFGPKDQGPTSPGVEQDPDAPYYRRNGVGEHVGRAGAGLNTK